MRFSKNNEQSLYIGSVYFLYFPLDEFYDERGYSNTTVWGILMRQQDISKIPNESFSTKLDNEHLNDSFSGPHLTVRKKLSALDHHSTIHFNTP